MTVFRFSNMISTATVLTKAIFPPQGYVALHGIYPTRLTYKFPLRNCTHGAVRWASHQTTPWSWFKLPETKSKRGVDESDEETLSSIIHDPSAYSRLSKPVAIEPRVHCMEFDEHGRVILMNAEYKKADLIAKYSLLPRDLRKIHSSTLPHIFVRDTAILINLIHLRVLIKHNRVLVFDAEDNSVSYTRSLFLADLEDRLRSVTMSDSPVATTGSTLPYEFQALEAVLISVTGALESEFEGVREPVLRLLRDLEFDIHREKLHYLLVYAKKLATFAQKVRLVRSALDELLNADDDLAAMYLTSKAEGHPRSVDDHMEIELLLESYHRVTDEILHAAENLVSNVRNTEDIIRVILDANRNSLMLLDLKFSVCMLGISVGTFIAALYGMNLITYLEDSPRAFLGISAASVIISLTVLSLGLRTLRRAQRVRISK